ncbi:hypothetical protein EVAR_84067_1 [Eumeta japonica]|uniref:Uncharacterized protein n=1 Tax=Eumeta variegata TaxID=151549 RepID=A0A4C1V093_EUMVA|nr:hypothetical protein EVAR_84067_1 [Eumeta japonica]
MLTYLGPCLRLRDVLDLLFPEFSLHVNANLRGLSLVRRYSETYVCSAGVTPQSDLFRSELHDSQSASNLSLRPLYVIIAKESSTQLTT